MAFHSEDVYVAGGNNKILHSWTPGVEKFDTSSFYNWEQDNIPLYDLEERTYFLWEKSGWPTSGAPQVSGVIFSVSADALGTDEFANNTNLFLDVSSAIEALPDVIRYPIRIEVANFGELGDLVLNNLHFTGNGALEIINRNFAPITPGDYSESDHLSTSSGVKSIVDGTNAGNDAGNTQTYIGDVSSTDVWNTLKDTSALGISTAVLADDPNNESRYENKNITFAQLLHTQKTNNNNTLSTKTARMSAGYARAVSNLFPSTDDINIQNYGSTNDYSISAYDFSGTTNQITNAPIYRKDLNSAGPEFKSPGRVVGAFYGNFFDSIKINNCAGNVYIRNFVVDGASGVSTPTAHTTEIGIQVNNSKVVLEHCAASRCLQAGFEFNNSHVVLSRGAIAFRNYGLSSNTASDHVRIEDPNAAGFRMYNSNVQLSTVGEYNNASGAGALFASTRNGTNGILMHNSTITGGGKRLDTNLGETMTSLQVYENQNQGIKMIGSKIDVDGAIDVWLHDIGIDAYNSTLRLDELFIDCNKTLGLNLKNSNLEYGKNKIGKSVGVGTYNAEDDFLAIFETINTDNMFYWRSGPGMLNFDANGQHINLNNSQIYHPRLSGATGLSRSQFFRNHGNSLAQAGSRKLSTPAIVCENNSDLKLTYARVQTLGEFFAGGAGIDPAAGNQKGTSNANYGSCLLVKDNSTCRLIGGENKFTFLDGPTNYENQQYNAGAYVNNNSKLILGGPTLFMRFGVDILVDNNSILDIGPPRDKNGFIDNDQWSLSVAANQTKVDLHSTRACLVANNNSVINMKDCGDFNGHWAKGDADEAVEGDANAWYASSLVINSNYDTYETSSYHSAGSVQFYPNPQLQSGLDTINPVGDFARTLSDVQVFPLKYGSESNDTSTLSFGGVCVRGMKGSSINVKNVNFPAGWNNTSSLYYDYADDSTDPNGCNQLRIWNIDNTSKLDMSHTSVSGHFPPLVGYNGPSAVYTDGGFGAALNAPDSTWITSALSVLDGYGPSGSIGAQNFGPFRIYTSPKRFAKYLVYKDEPSNETGIIYQTIAQGYNMSGACSAVYTTSDNNMGPDTYSVYGAGTTAPSSIHNEISFSSVHSYALFTASPWGYARDARIYTSATFMSTSSMDTETINSVAPGREDLTAPASDKADGFPGYNLGWTGNYSIPWAKPFFKHYKEADFFYAKDFVPDDYEYRITLDESAIATFANAKNGTLGISGRPKIVTMKTSTVSFAGEGAESEAPQAGIGFLSASEFDLDKQD